MKRRLVAGAAPLALFAAVASPASADRGSPGSTYPEQPGTHVASACGAIVANTGTAQANSSPTASAITTGNLIDACFE